MKNKGFTMIEIVVTISMLLLASSILIGTVIGVTRRNETQKLTDVKLAIVSAATMYVSDKGTCPNTVAQLLSEKLISKDLVDPYNISWTSDCELEDSVTITKK